ncbi:phytanoyl-CoA dioxygenase family protein [Thermaurantiacus sp.]
MTGDLEARYRRDGYAVVRGFFPPEDVSALAALVDEVEAAARAHGRPFRHGNLFYDVRAGGHVAMAQWPVWHFPALDAFRTDRRFLALLQTLLGPDLKQIIHQIHWKPQGPGADFAWHQDSRSRRPRAAFRNLGEAYVQTGLALDPHDEASGCLRVIPGSHHLGDLRMREGEAVLGRAVDDADLVAAGLDPSSARLLELEPGDLALWSPFLVHASGPNRSHHKRRLFLNGYVRAGDCDRGEWAFRGGEPVALPAQPSLVHYEGLHARPEPHDP